MQPTLAIHILAGGLSIVVGTIALAVTKGSSPHRKVGRLFVYAMVVMALTGAALAIVSAEEISLIAGLLTLYLVVTALTTVQTAAWTRGLDVAAMIFGLALAFTSLAAGVTLVSIGVMTLDGLPTPILFKFGGIALLAGIGDVRRLRSGGLRGPRRLARHLWRMCFAFYVAVASFFLGQAQVFPEALQGSGLLALPVLAVIVAMVYWLWRIRVRGNLEGLVGDFFREARDREPGEVASGR